MIHLRDYYVHLKGYLHILCLFRAFKTLLSEGIPALSLTYFHNTTQQRFTIPETLPWLFGCSVINLIKSTSGLFRTTPPHCEQRWACSVSVHKTISCV